MRPDAATAPPVLASALYEGVVRHRRHGPRPHAFRYRLFMVYLDLDELDAVARLSRWWSVDRRNLAEIRRSDYLGAPDVPLKEAVLTCIEAATGERPAGPVRMLTHGRYFGYCFNPVTFYYAWDRGTLHTIVAEITNTPWRERHRYVLPLAEARRGAGATGPSAGDAYEFSFPKAFHVSPFLDMDLAYRWRFSTPERRLLVHMDNLTGRDERAFDATLTLTRTPMTPRSLAGVLRRYPLMTTQVIAGIHWQALKLWVKGNPVYDHPAGAERGGRQGTSPGRGR